MTFRYGAAFVALSTAIPAYGGGVALTFDDGYKSMEDIVLPLFRSKHVVGTLYVSTGFLDEPKYMSSESLKDFVSAGWELGGHSIVHDDMTLMGIEEITKNLVEPKEVIEKETGVEVVTFASPFGNYNDILLAEVSKYYKAHVNAWGPADGENHWPSMDPNNINRYTVRSTDSVDKLCSMIENITEDEVYAFVLHDIVEEEPKEDRPFDVTVATLEAMLDCIVENDVYQFRIKDMVK